MCVLVLSLLITHTLHLYVLSPSHYGYCLSLSVDMVDDDLEITMVCHRPEGLDKLEAQTNFSKRELQELYRGFKNVRTHTYCTYSQITVHQS